MTTLSAEVAEAVRLLKSGAELRCNSLMVPPEVCRRTLDLIECLHAQVRELEAELEQEAHVSNLIINGLRLKTAELENELEQARAECEAIKLRSGELCEKCGWRSKFVGNQCLCCMANAENFP